MGQEKSRAEQLEELLRELRENGWRRRWNWNRSGRII